MAHGKPHALRSESERISPLHETPVTGLRKREISSLFVAQGELHLICS